MSNYQIYNLDRITFNTRVMAGQACIRGMRIPVSLIIFLRTVKENSLHKH